MEMRGRRGDDRGSQKVKCGPDEQDRTRRSPGVGPEMDSGMCVVHDADLGLLQKPSRSGLTGVRVGKRTK